MRLSTSLRLNAQKGLVTPYDPTLTLSLQFATRQAYVSDFGPLPTFTNATTTARTYVGSDGLLKTAGLNVPRIEFNPITRQCLGLLIEEQRQNLTPNSEDFTQAAWTKLNVTAASNVAISPDGNTTADSITETSANAQHYINTQSYSVSSGTTYTYSVFLKKGTGSTAPDWISILMFTGAFGAKYIAFNVSTGAFGASSGGLTGTSKQYPNGWWRASVSSAAIATGVLGGAYIAFTNNVNVASAPTYTGQTTSNIFVWGAQFEAGSFASSYIPTTTTSLVRSADVCSITGAAFTGFYNQTEGAMVVKGSRIGLQPSPVPGYIQIDDGTANERILLYNSGVSEDYLVTDNGLTSANLSTGATVPNNTLFGMAARYKNSDFAVSRSGASSVTVASGSVPTVTAFRIGNRNTSGFHNGHIHTIQYFNAIKTNAQLQALSTP